MRGTRRSACRRPSDRRFIPAHAGNTPGHAPSGANIRVHPRACGEHTPARYTRIRCTGSSPRMRGTRSVSSATRLLSRFIPAHAGNTLPSFRARGAQSVHPRACGEHVAGIIALFVDPGSSPRMRGTHPGSSSRDERSRFIPAHAGNTTGSGKTSTNKAVHPRACGEHAKAGCRLSVSTGSSPRMRGTLVCWHGSCLFSRFIPAHAGNTALGVGGWTSVPVHPRACGEHYEGVVPEQFHTGSSPRMRGTLFIL